MQLLLPPFLLKVPVFELLFQVSCLVCWLWVSRSLLRLLPHLFQLILTPTLLFDLVYDWRRGTELCLGDLGDRDCTLLDDAWMIGGLVVFHFK